MTDRSASQPVGGTDPFTICLGTINEGVWTSHDKGATWARATMELPDYALVGEVDVRAVEVSPRDPQELWAASTGAPGAAVLLRSRDAGGTWRRVDAPLDGVEVWAIAISPHDPEVILVGARPAGILRSGDGGVTWAAVPLNAPTMCVEAGLGSTRLTSITFDPADPGTVWAGVEIGGLYRSSDTGRTWERLSLSGGEAIFPAGEVWSDFYHEDVHDIVVLDDDRAAVCVASPLGFFRSDDRGRSFTATRLPPMPPSQDQLFYTRCLMSTPGGGPALLAGTGDRVAAGTMGVVQRTEDGGRTWAPVSPQVNSRVYAMASHPGLPDVIVAVSIYGNVLVSEDGGKSFEKLGREFGETRAVAVTPARPVVGAR